MKVNKTWKKAAAFAMALALMGGVVGIAGNANSRITASAADEEIVQSFKVTADPNTVNGSVFVDKETAAAEETVIAVPVPDQGFTVSKVTVNGEQIAVNDQDQYAFSMPAVDSVVSAEFVEYNIAPDYTIQTTSGGSISVRTLINGSSQLLKIVPAADDGYVLDKVLINGNQIAVNEDGEYLVDCTGESMVISAEFVESKDISPVSEVIQCENGKLIIENIVTELYNAFKVTPVPDEGYSFEKLYYNGIQAAVNDQGEYIIENGGDTNVLTADFVKTEPEVNVYNIADTVNGKITAEVKTDDTNTFVEVTAAPDAGYQLGKIICNGEQVAVNDKGKYVIAFTGTTLELSAEFVQAPAADTVFTITPGTNGTITAETRTDGSNTFVEVTAVPDAGYQLGKIICNGEQVAVNDEGKYLIAYTGTALNLSAEFVKAEAEPSAQETKDEASAAEKQTESKAAADSKAAAKTDTTNAPKTGAVVGIGTAALLAGAAVVFALKKRK